MREILFRGKRLDNGEWVEGYYCKHDTVKVCFTTDDPKTKHLIIMDGFCDWGFEPPLQGVEVDPATIGQYIGRQDKNGKRVFESDTVRFKRKFVHGGAVVRIGRIVYDERNARFHISDSDGYICWDIYEVEDIEVVHDNPELLEVNEDE